MGQINIGLTKVELGNIAVDGGMGTTLAALGNTLEGTMNLNTDDPQVTEFFVEEFDDPLHEEHREGKKTIAFTVADPDLQTLVKVFGGAVTGTGVSEVYTPPLTPATVEQSVKITPKRGIGFNIVRAKITAKFTSQIGRGALLGLEISGAILRPTKADTAPFTIFKVVP